MASIFKMCKVQIENDRKYGTNKMTMAKLDVFLANDRLTIEEYEQLVAMLETE